MAIEFNPNNDKPKLIPTSIPLGKQSTQEGGAGLFDKLSISSNAEIQELIKKLREDPNIANELDTIEKVNIGNDEINKLYEKVNNLKASNGMTYKEAKEIMKSIKAKYMPEGNNLDPFSYKKNPYVKEVHDQSPTDPNGITYTDYRFHFEIDETKLPEPDKTEYIRAKAAVEEIQRNNSALFAELKPHLMLSI